MKPSLLPTSLLAALLLSACAKDDDPQAQLPLETRTGANTIGCLVNGQLWTPKGYNGTLNYTVSYDRTYRKGTLNVGTYRYIGKGADDYQMVGFYADSIPSTGTYSLAIPDHHEGIFLDRTGTCQFPGNDPYFRKGQLTITRLDMQAGIVSGTFWFTLYKPGCDSIRVTNGRFDKKL
ncbi:hypothetical protein Q5H93_06075 [Hymenobacter sp. ASUV-10]|uniref:Lipoprotein n=1 Tax=Hymenobacter aranciens TaxID=3063996 RepID=A0ABT9B7W6_9BACT|nr:hypothetical protein [Hymenobacter sp. ASUV-10]MDO7874293.1 hypothetical protein [Hymenobacter sp. ASUV-10]